VDDTEFAKAPKSFVIKTGIVGRGVAQLVRDIRKVMEPNTASNLRVCRNPFFFFISFFQSSF